MNNISMFPHVGSGNHGCEAIVRSTSLLFGKQNVALFSNHPEEDKKYIDDVLIEIHKDNTEIQRFSALHLKALWQRDVLRKKDAFNKLTFSPLLNKCQKGDVLLSIGGDLYCYDTPEYIYKVNTYARNQGCKTVLWGCSVEPSYIDERMKKDISEYDLICARESITYKALNEINPNTILTVDPAFTLPPKKCDLPAESYIGVNISPMITKLENKFGITLENYKNLIQHILDICQEHVALIPHVVWKTNDDREPLKYLKDYFRDNERVVLVEDHNAVEQKYIIANCRMFIGARTHATIAAYSSEVPTLVVGYSVKAKGIAKDLFGDFDDYVVPVQSLADKYDLCRSFEWLIENEKQIRERLNSFLPEYISRIKPAVAAVKALL